MGVLPGNAPIPAPIRRPVGPGGLFDAARTNAGTNPALPDTYTDTNGNIVDLRWEGGGAFVPQDCGTAQVTDPCDPDAFDPVDQRAAVEWEPFVIQSGQAADTLGGGCDLWGRTREQMDLATLFEVEEEFWTGAQTIESGWPNYYLTDPRSTDITVGTDLPLTFALGKLQKRMAACLKGRVGVIHATRETVTQWQSAYVVQNLPGTNLIVDLYGNLVVAGSGYTGGAPRVNEVTSITIAAGSGTWTLTVTGEGAEGTVIDIAWNVTAAALQTALVTEFGAGVTVSGGPGATNPLVITWGSTETTLRDLTVTTSAAGLAGGTATVSTTTPGGTVIDSTGDTSWVYGTGTVDVRVSDTRLIPDTPEAAAMMGTVLTENNDLEVRSTRYGLVTFDPCCFFAVNVNLCEPCCTPS